MILQGADGVEYLIVAVDASTLMDFLENEEDDWEEKALDLYHLHFIHWLYQQMDILVESVTDIKALEPSFQALQFKWMAWI